MSSKLYQNIKMYGTRHYSAFSLIFKTKIRLSRSQQNTNETYFLFKNITKRKAYNWCNQSLVFKSVPLSFFFFVVSFFKRLFPQKAVESWASNQSQWFVNDISQKKYKMCSSVWLTYNLMMMRHEKGLHILMPFPQPQWAGLFVNWRFFGCSDIT